MSDYTSWARLLGADPVPGLLTSTEPAARWVARTAVLDQPADAPEVLAASAAVRADHGTEILIARLPDWTAGGRLSGHHDPRFAPNLLNLLADMGMTADHPRIGQLLDVLIDHQDSAGRFMSFGSSRAGEEAVWGSLPCDSHAITEVLVRYGRVGDLRVQRALSRIGDDLTSTAQGRAWLCLPHTATGFRGPGRKSDFCPQVTLQAIPCRLHDLGMIVRATRGLSEEEGGYHWRGELRLWDKKKFRSRPPRRPSQRGAGVAPKGFPHVTYHATFPPPAGAVRAPRRPSSRGYWVGGGLVAAACVGAVAWIVLAFFGLMNKADGFQRMTVPGTATVHVGQAATRVPYYEGPRYVLPVSQRGIHVTGPAGEPSR